MTELRRANHLWSHDSIHLRHTLYIPLKNEQDNPFPESSIAPMRRVPASQLSFFPPPSKLLIDLSTPPPSPTLKQAKLPGHVRSATLPSIPISTSTTMRRAAAATIATTNAAAAAAASHSQRQRTVSSILSAIPIAARLSLDSVRSGSDEGMEHELDDVSRKDSVRAFTAPAHRFPPRERKLRERNGRDPLYRHPAPPPPLPPSPRTLQLQPSASMQLPTLSSKGRAIEVVREATLIRKT